MRVAGFMSGSGSNIRRLILESKKDDAYYEITVIFSDRANSRATEIGKEFDIPVVTRDIQGFYAARGRPLNDMLTRRDFDLETVCAIQGYGVDVIAYGGYMSKATAPLLERYLGINVHPADLSVMRDGKRAYTGDKAVKRALDAGERTVRATTHIVEERVDYGRILMVSAPLEVRAGETPDEVQTRLKEAGDWVIFPQTLKNLADGRFCQDEQGRLYFDGKLIPDGVRLE